MPEPRSFARPHVLVTRPEPGATDTAARLAGRGFAADVAPLLTIERRTPALPPAVQAVLVTSANAIGTVLPDATVFAVGDTTAARAQVAGARRVVSAGRNAEALVALVLRECRPDDGTLLLLSGARQGLGLAASLRTAGFRVLRRVTYQARAAAALPGSAVEFLRAGRGFALFFSPETAHVFVRLTKRAGMDDCVMNIAALAISPSTAAALTPLNWSAIRVAAHPNQDALLALLP